MKQLFNSLRTLCLMTMVCAMPLGAWANTEGNVQKVDAQWPTKDNDFVGWPDYYKVVTPSQEGSDQVSYYEDVDCTRPIADLAAWKAKYSAPFKVCYDAGHAEGVNAAVPPAPTKVGMHMKVTTKSGSEYIFHTSDIKKVEYHRVTK